MKRPIKNTVRSPSPRLRYPLTKSISLVGLMGSGKTTVGRRLARKLGVSFIDSDEEIELAAGHTVSEIFEKFGEADFRSGERRVISRLISNDPMVLGTGGGAFMDRETRRRLKEKTITIWLKADIAHLVERTSRRNTRPLLRDNDPEEILSELAKKRYPVYGQAAIMVTTGCEPHEKVVNDIIWKLNQFLARELKKETQAQTKHNPRHHNRNKKKNAATQKNFSDTPLMEKDNEPKNNG